MFTAVIMLGSEISLCKKSLIENRVGIVSIDSDSIAVETEGQVTVNFEAADEDAAGAAAEQILDAVREIVSDAYLEGCFPNG